MNTMKRFAVLVIIGTTWACKNLDVPDYYAPSITTLQQGANRAQIAVAAVGLLAFSRDVEAPLSSGSGTLVVDLGQQGREGIRLDPSNPQQVLDNFVGGTRGPGSGTWTNLYRGLRQANLLLTGVSTATGLTDPEKEAVRGFAKTMKAVGFQRLNAGWDAAGQPIDVDRATTDPLPAVATSDQVKAYVVQLLEEAKVHLQNGGSTFPFALHSGFTGFDTPATFLKFNRALRAREAIYVQDYNGALTALNESFISTTASLSLGVSDIYSTASGDKTNPLYEPIPRSLFSLPQNETEAKLQPNGVTRDLRYVQKIQPITPRLIDGVTVSHVFTIYNSFNTPIPIIRNEELILIRAEANLSLGNRAAALTDINFIRVNSGGLAPLAADPGDPGLLDELLYNRRYSLIWESGHRWIDMRRYNRLDQLPKALPTHKIWANFQLPLAECTPRNPQPSGCSFPQSY